MNVFEWMAIVLGGVLIINFFLMIYVACFVLEDIEAMLLNTKVVVDAKAVGACGRFVGGMWRMGMVFNAFLFAKSWSKKGIVSLEDVSRVPLRKKCWIYIPMFTAFLTSMSIPIVVRGLGP